MVEDPCAAAPAIRAVQHPAIRATVKSLTHVVNNSDPLGEESRGLPPPDIPLVFFEGIVLSRQVIGLLPRLQDR